MDDQYTCGICECQYHIIIAGFCYRFSSITSTLGAHQHLHWSLVQTKGAGMEHSPQIPAVPVGTTNAFTRSSMEMVAGHRAIMCQTWCISPVFLRDPWWQILQRLWFLGEPSWAWDGWRLIPITFSFSTFVGLNLESIAFYVVLWNSCSNLQTGDLTKSDRAIDGIFGFGQQGMSVISQLSSQGIAPRVFSHCLKGDNSGGGILVLGEIVELNMVYSPLVPSQYVMLHFVF